MKTSFFALATLACCLAACGGGSGSGDTAAATQSTRLDAYIGTWASGCDNHAVDTATITRSPGTTDSIDIAFKTNYFSLATCSGTLLATQTASGVITAKYVATVDSSIVFTTGAAAVPAKVDTVTASAPQMTTTITGPGVVHTVANGQAQWCIDYGSGNSTCIRDDGVQAAQSGVAGGLYLQGTDLFELTPSGSVFAVNSKFAKATN